MLAAAVEKQSVEAPVGRPGRAAAPVCERYLQGSMGEVVDRTLDFEKAYKKVVKKRDTEFDFYR